MEQPLKRQFRRWTVLLVIVPSLLIMTIYTVSQINIVKEKNKEMISQQVAFQEGLIYYWLEERTNDVRKVSQLEAFKRLDYVEMRTTLDLMQRYSQEFDSLSYIDKDGFFKISTLSTGIKYASVIGKPYYQAALAGQEYVSDVVIGRNSGLPIINFSSPIYDKSGNFQGLILGSVRTTTIQALLRKNRTGQTGEILLVDSKGTMIAKPRSVSALVEKRLVEDVSNMHMKISTEALKNIRFGETGSSSWVDYVDSRVIGAYRYMPERDWTLVGKIDESELLAPIYSQLLMMAGGTIVLVLLFLPLATLVTNQIKRPIEWLISQSFLVATKNYGKVGIEKYPDQIPKELGVLCAAFIQMSREIESTIDIIKQSEEKVANQMLELQKAQLELQNTKRIRDILDQCPVGIVVVDKYGIVEAMNEFLISVVPGRTWRDCIDYSYFDVIARMGRTKDESPIQWALQGIPTHNQVMSFGGRDWVVNVTPIYNNEEITGVIGVFQDITETLKAEREAVEVLQRFEIMFTHNLAAVGVYRVSDWKILDVNPAWEQVYGFSRAEAIGKTLNELGFAPPKASQDSHESPTGPINVIAQSEDLEVRGNDGVIRNVLFSALRIHFDGEPCILATALDVTDKRRMEKEMAHLARLNLVGEMAASIGHEVRNPLTTVRGYLQLFQGKEYFAKYYGQLSLMIEELDRANAIITEFLSLAKNKTVEMKPGKLNDVIAALYPLLLADALRMGHDINLELGPIPEMTLSEKEIRQMLLNLVRNGFEAMEHSGVVSIRTYAVNGQILLEIKDSGKGIPDEVMGKLGTPFVTTKEGGTGLGLAVCYRVAERHGAKIDATTGSDGTTFIINFPCQDLLETKG